MRRTLPLALVVCLLAPAGASAKGGVIFDKYPDVQSVGSQMRFTVMLFDRRDVRPLVTFRNAKTGEVVRVRASRSDLNGIAHGRVALPSTGPWDTVISVNGRAIFEGDAEPFRVGVGLTQTIPAADAARTADARGGNAGASAPSNRGASAPSNRGASADGAASAERGASAAPWIALAALASAAAAGFAVHRRRRWGAA